MTGSPETLRTGAVLASGLIYWIGVLVQTFRLKQRTGKSAHLRPKGLKERLLWMCWLFVITGWIGQPLVVRIGGKNPLFSISDLLLTDVGKAIGLLFLISGYAGTIWCYRILGDSWRVGVNRKERTHLITTGPYRFVRHPLYAFQIMMLVGAGLLLPTLYSLFILVVQMLSVRIKAADEENYLLAVHGATYKEYVSATGRLLPRFLPKRSATARDRAASLKKKKTKSTMIQIMEYGGAASLFFLVQLIPLPVIQNLSSFLGRLFFRFVPNRRRIAMDNLTHAFPDRTAEDIERIARESFISVVLTFLESAKFRRVFAGRDASERVRQSADGLEELFQKARKVHDESGGCIFVTPHIGNWELLPHVSALVGIPLSVVVRPLDNPYLERLIYQSRTGTGQAIIPKRNAFFVLQKTLQEGRSIGMLPDQSTMKGIMIDFFGRKATATPVPALLAISYNRPIVVVACCRKSVGKYEGFVCNPIWPGSYESEKAEIFRITSEMTKDMESIIRTYPEQYLWMHNRWKTYKNKKEFLS